MTDSSPWSGFLAAFSALREATGDSPERLAAMFQNSDRLTGLAREVGSEWDFVSLLATHRKVFAQVSPEFIEAGKDYLDRWQPAVEFVKAWPILTFTLDGRPPSSLPSYEKFKSGKSWVARREKSEPDWEDSFHPVRHHGGAEIRQMLLLVDHFADTRLDELGNALKIGSEALSHFERVTGLDIAEAFDRWNRIPPIFVPEQVSDRHGLSDKGSLFGLLEDAIRAYVAGATGASVAMCRAVLERLLREHYLLSPPDERVSLTEIIEEARKTGQFPKGMRDGAWQLKNLADAVLHRAGQATARDEEKLIAAFGHLKHWIESAPIRRDDQ